MKAAAQALAALLPVLEVILVVLYGLATTESRGERARRVLLMALLGLHGALLLLVWNLGGVFPMAHPAWILSGVAGALLFLYAIVEWTTRSAAGGAVVVSLALVLQTAAAMIWPAVLPAAARQSSPFFAPHAIGLLLGLGALLLSGAYGLLWVLLWRALRHGRFGLLFRMVPDLPGLTRMNRRAALFGFIAVGIGLNAGIWWAHDTGRQVVYTSPEILTLVVVWLLFGLLAFAGRLRFMTERRAAWSSALVAALALLALLFAVLPGGIPHGGD
jgi:ABC-type transport system involved in cytochrome c biogenesis permease subunit